MNMTRFKIALGPVAAVLLTMMGVPAAAAEDEGAKVFQDACTRCHNAKEHPLDAVRLARDKWKSEVERMEGNGAEIPSGQKLNALLDWLERTHGPGSAPADEKK
jgi:hypothetical protein